MESMNLKGKHDVMICFNLKTFQY